MCWRNFWKGCLCGNRALQSNYTHSHSHTSMHACAHVHMYAHLINIKLNSETLLLPKVRGEGRMGRGGMWGEREEWEGEGCEGRGKNGKGRDVREGRMGRGGRWGEREEWEGEGGEGRGKNGKGRDAVYNTAKSWDRLLVLQLET